MPTCPGCNVWFAIGRYSSHLRQTKNRNCIAVRDAGEAFGDFDETGSDRAAGDDEARQFEGDALGAYGESDFEEVGGQDVDERLGQDEEAHTVDDDTEERVDSEDDKEEWGLGLGDEEDAENALQEEGWEPPLPEAEDRMDEDQEAEPDEGGEGRDGDIDGLAAGGEPIMDKGARPFITKYPDPRAGAPSADRGRSGWQDYQARLTNGGPWTSKLDWEFARWAQLRGPSASALTELLKIDGVSTFNLLLIA